jgi:hypothetical protein
MKSLTALLAVAAALRLFDAALAVPQLPSSSFRPRFRFLTRS